MVDLFGDGGVLDISRHLILPALTLAAVATAVFVRLTRTSMLESLRQDYIRTARAKGLTERSVISRHAFRNALVSVVPVIGLEAGFVLGGAVYIENVFQWPGIGRMLVNAISTRDILLVEGGVLVVALAYVLINLLTDLVQSALDPRIRAGMTVADLPNLANATGMTARPGSVASPYRAIQLSPVPWLCWRWSSSSYCSPAPAACRPRRSSTRYPAATAVSRKAISLAPTRSGATSFRA